MYYFRTYMLGKELSSVPLTNEQLLETIKANIENGITYFEVEKIKSED